MHTDPRELDAQFEQWLLDSARRDMPPPELTRHAWARFAKTSGQTAAAATGGPLLSRLGLRAALSKAAWLGAGMLAGSALTAAVLSPREAPITGDAREAAPLPIRARNEPREADEPTARREPTAQTRRAAPSEGDDSATTHAPRAKPRGSPEAAPVAPPIRRASPTPSSRASSSNLAAEVRAVDAVRREIEAGQPERALAAIKDFHRDFPRAQLAADAEGLAIEALLARGDHAGAAERARQLLRRYPEDPHAARFEPIARER